MEHLSISIALYKNSVDVNRTLFVLYGVGPNGSVAANMSRFFSHILCIVIAETIAVPQKVDIQFPYSIKIVVAC